MVIMAEATTSTPRIPPAPAELSRRSRGRLVAGVAGGVADWLGVEAVYVRAAFCALSLVWGAGVVLYLAIWGATLDRVSDGPSRRVDTEHRVGLLVAFLGGLLLLRGVGLWPGDAVVWPGTAVLLGLAFLLDRREIDPREAMGWLLRPTDGHRSGRTVVGIGLLVVGLGILGSGAVPELGTVFLAVAVTGAGLTLLFGPWVWRLAQDLGRERRERIRQEERAEMAAHLHDSVLQTLALIQRTDDPRRMVTLARAQERELRRWLFESAPEAGAETLSSALRSAAERAEADHDVPVEVVTVGDAHLDERLRALAAAAGEAITNAASHSGAGRVSVFCEVTDEAVEVFVVDQGKGFDPEAVADDRRGIRDSIVGRVERHGGQVSVDSEPGEGTEVALRMTREGETPW